MTERMAHISTNSVNTLAAFSVQLGNHFSTGPVISGPGRNLMLPPSTPTIV